MIRCIVGWEETQDECSVCVYEHENWGDNEYYKECKYKTRTVWLKYEKKII